MKGKLQEELGQMKAESAQLAEKAMQLELELKENKSKVEKIRNADANRITEQRELDVVEKTKAQQLEKLDAEIARLRDIEMREREEHIRMKQAALEAREKELMNSS